MNQLTVMLNGNAAPMHNGHASAHQAAAAAAAASQYFTFAGGQTTIQGPTITLDPSGQPHQHHQQQQQQQQQQQLSQQQQHATTAQLVTFQAQTPTGAMMLSAAPVGSQTFVHAPQQTQQTMAGVQQPPPGTTFQYFIAQPPTAQPTATHQQILTAAQTPQFGMMQNATLLGGTNMAAMIPVNQSLSNAGGTIQIPGQALLQTTQNGVTLQHTAAAGTQFVTMAPNSAGQGTIPFQPNPLQQQQQQLFQQQQQLQQQQQQTFQFQTMTPNAGIPSGTIAFGTNAAGQLMATNSAIISAQPQFFINPTISSSSQSNNHLNSGTAAATPTQPQPIYQFVLPNGQVIQTVQPNITANTLFSSQFMQPQQQQQQQPQQQIISNLSQQQQPTTAITVPIHATTNANGEMSIIGPSGSASSSSPASSSSSASSSTKATAFIATSNHLHHSQQQQQQQSIQTGNNPTGIHQMIAQQQQQQQLLQHHHQSAGGILPNGCGPLMITAQSPGSHSTQSTILLNTTSPPFPTISQTYHQQQQATPPYSSSSTLLIPVVSNGSQSTQSHHLQHHQQQQHYQQQPQQPSNNNNTTAMMVLTGGNMMNGTSNGSSCGTTAYGIHSSGLIPNTVLDHKSMKNDKTLSINNNNNNSNVDLAAPPQTTLMLVTSPTCTSSSSSSRHKSLPTSQAANSSSITTTLVNSKLLFSPIKNNQNQNKPFEYSPSPQMCIDKSASGGQRTPSGGQKSNLIPVDQSTQCDNPQIMKMLESIPEINEDEAEEEVEKAKQEAETETTLIIAQKSSSSELPSEANEQIPAIIETKSERPDRPESTSSYGSLKIAEDEEPEEEEQEQQQQQQQLDIERESESMQTDVEETNDTFSNETELDCNSPNETEPETPLFGEKVSAPTSVETSKQDDYNDNDNGDSCGSRDLEAEAGEEEEEEETNKEALEICEEMTQNTNEDEHDDNARRLSQISEKKDISNNDKQQQQQPQPPPQPADKEGYQSSYGSSSCRFTDTEDEEDEDEAQEKEDEEDEDDDERKKRSKRMRNDCEIGDGRSTKRDSSCLKFVRKTDLTKAVYDLINNGVLGTECGDDQTTAATAAANTATSNTATPTKIIGTGGCGGGGDTNGCETMDSKSSLSIASAAGGATDLDNDEDNDDDDDNDDDNEDAMSNDSGATFSLQIQTPSPSGSNVSGQMEPESTTSWVSKEKTIINIREGTYNGINLEPIREFAKRFKMFRLGCGLTQSQVCQDLTLKTDGQTYSQSAICRFEKLDITPKSAVKIKPVLESWMRISEEKYPKNKLIDSLCCGDANGGANGSNIISGCKEHSSFFQSFLLHQQHHQQQHTPHGGIDGAKSSEDESITSLNGCITFEPGKKRKKRTSFTPDQLDALNHYFEANPKPSSEDMTRIAKTLGACDPKINRDVVRVWFCNKRQALKAKRIAADGSTPSPQSQPQPLITATVNHQKHHHDVSRNDSNQRTTSATSAHLLPPPPPYPLSLPIPAEAPKLLTLPANAGIPHHPGAIVPVASSKSATTTTGSNAAFSNNGLCGNPIFAARRTGTESLPLSSNNGILAVPSNTTTNTSTTTTSATHHHHHQHHSLSTSFSLSTSSPIGSAFKSTLFSATSSSSSLSASSSSLSSKSLSCSANKSTLPTSPLAKPMN